MTASPISTSASPSPHPAKGETEARRGRSLAADRRAYRLLVVAGGGGVEQPVTDIDRVAHAALALFRVGTRNTPTPSLGISTPLLSVTVAILPDVHVEVNIESGLVDIVADRYDAGVRLGEALGQGMIAVPRVRVVAFGAPSYFAERGTRRTP